MEKEYFNLFYSERKVIVMYEKRTKILLICYSFPPFPGIGGRRWAKFSKYLSKEGCEIYVLGAAHRSGKESNWLHDVSNNPNINYFPIRTKFHSFFHDHNFNFIKKINYKISKFYLEHKFEGNYYDKVLASNDMFYEKAKELIVKHEIKNLLITIAPNRLVDVGVKLKREFPDLNFIYDIRDPWNICLDDWDHKYLSEEQKAFELKTELEAASTADKVFSVYQNVVDFYREKFPDKKGDFIYLPNGFDRDEILYSENKSENLGSKYFVYTGILYDTAIDMFDEFAKEISNLKNDSPFVLKELEFRFYIPSSNLFKQTVEKHGVGDYIKFYNQVSLIEIQKIISNSIGCMLFLPLNFEFSLSTKFYEYVAHNKKIIVFSAAGEVTNLMSLHNLGYAMLPGNVSKTLRNAIIELTSESKLPEHTFDLESCSIDKLTAKIIPNLI